MIEFRNEGWCRWNGTLMSPENCKKLFGIEGEVYIEDSYIINDCTIYTDRPIGEVLYTLGARWDEPEEYDYTLNEGYGYKDHCWEEKLAGHIMFNTEFIRNLIVKPYCAFHKDYPNFNKDKYNAFYNELDEYYEKMRNGEVE